MNLIPGWSEHLGLGIIVPLHKDKVIRCREVIVRRFMFRGSRVCLGVRRGM
jgi:hypothetical protein